MKKTNTPPIINRILFYIIAFFTGIVVLPATGGVGFALLLCGIICPEESVRWWKRHRSIWI